MSAGSASGPSLLDAANAIKADRDAQFTRCPVARLLQGMTPADVADLTTLLLMDSRDMSNLIIAMTLRGAGHLIEEGPIASHRRMLKGGQGCKCRS